MVRGKVTNIPSNQTQFGTMFNAVIDGKSYGVGKYAPKFQIGDYVEFEITPESAAGRFPKIDYKSVRVLPEPAGYTAPAPAPAPTATKSYGGDDKRQEIISRQACRNTAIEWINVLITQDALPVPKAAKPDKKFDLLNGILDRMTDEFLAYSLGKAKPKEVLVEEPVATDDEWQE